MSWQPRDLSPDARRAAEAAAEAAGQPLRDVPWERPPGVKATDTGGNLRTTMDEVKSDAGEPRKKKG